MCRKTSIVLRIVGFLLAALVATACTDERNRDHKTSSAHETEEHAEKNHQKEKHGHEPMGQREASHHQTARGAHKHLHGDATLAIAREDSLLFFELDTPLYNLVGFEHAPQTSEHTRAVQRAEQLLDQPRQLFIINPEAKCQFRQRNDAVTLTVPPSHDDHERHASSQEGISDKQENTVVPTADTHRDVILDFTCVCELPSQITDIRVNLFDHFPYIEELEVIYLDQSKQYQTTLTANDRELKTNQ